jgi:Gas vesicle synthesis protein GvpL/GvpF
VKATGGRVEVEPGRGSADASELLWAYCVLRAGDRHPSDLAGVDPAAAVHAEDGGGLVALVSLVPKAEFGSDALRRNLNDLEWLERVARAHEAVLEETLELSTLVPLRMCTLYESGESVRRMLERERDDLVDALDALDGRSEWAVKVLADRDKLREAARARSDSAGVRQRQLAEHGKGGAYMLRRRFERELRAAAHSLAAEIAGQVHARLQDWAIDAITSRPQNRELSGHQGDMLLNGAYLVERERVGELQELVRELEDDHSELGIRIELSGPWPPYNFVSRGDAATIT